MPVSSGLEYLIPVQFDPADYSLTIEHPELRLRPGDRVIWDFLGTPAGWAPWIQLKPESGPESGPRSFLGPFASLAQVESGVWATVAGDAPEGSFIYRASIQKGLGLDWMTPTSVLNSRQAAITVHNEPFPDTAVFTVSPNEEKEGTLKVEPGSLSLMSGQSILWMFQGFSADPATWDQWRPRIDFGRYEGSGEVPAHALGPFTCLLYEVGQVTGLGNSGVTGHYHFEVSLIEIESGEVRWVNSGDPAIDNQGPAWNPVSGGPPGG
jgi:hypothetical protein